MREAAEFDKVSGSAVEQVVQSIRALIAEAGLTVGDRLPTERELCDRFSASRNTVREAMRMLKAYGVVDVRPKVGATIIDQRMNRAFDLFSFNVRAVSRRTFDDIQGFRELIETGAVLQIFDAVTPADLVELRALNLQMVRAPNLIAASEFDLQLHTRIVALIGNGSILDVYGLMTPVILRIMQHGKTRRKLETETYHEHAAIIDAIEARDSLAYRYLMRTHLRAGTQSFADDGPVTAAGPQR